MMLAINNLNENIRTNTATAQSNADKLQKAFTKNIRPRYDDANFSKNTETRQNFAPRGNYQGGGNRNSYRQGGNTVPVRDAFPDRTDLCFYHRRFGKNALKCRTEECAWDAGVPSKPGPSGGRGN
jgi:hypothetical protein